MKDSERFFAFSVFPMDAGNLTEWLALMYLVRESFKRVYAREIGEIETMAMQSASFGRNVWKTAYVPLVDDTFIRVGEHRLILDLSRVFIKLTKGALSVRRPATARSSVVHAIT